MPTTPPTIYLLHGDDEIAIREALARLRLQLGDPAMADLNTTHLEGRGLSLETLRDACGAAPFIARRRMVLVDGFFARRKEGEESDQAEVVAAGRPQSLDSLWEILEDVPATTALVFVERRALAPKHAMVTWCARQGERAWVKLYEAPRPAALPGWVVERAKLHGGNIQRDAAQQLSVAVGEDLPRLDGEILKLLAYVDRARPVTAEDVRRLTPETAETDVFAMVDAIGQRDGTRALRLLHKMLGEQEALYVMGMVVRQVRMLLLAREAMDAGRRGSALGRALREIPMRETEHIHPFVAEKLEAQAGRFTLGALEQLFGELRDLDEDIKTGKIAAPLGLEAMVAAWCTR